MANLPMSVLSVKNRDHLYDHFHFHMLVIDQGSIPLFLEFRKYLRWQVHVGVHFVFLEIKYLCTSVQRLSLRDIMTSVQIYFSYI
jgi:hypothetical protein